jgi:hypothetical protein
VTSRYQVTQPLRGVRVDFVVEVHHFPRHLMSVLVSTGWPHHSHAVPDHRSRNRRPPSNSHSNTSAT